MSEENKEVKTVETASKKSTWLNRIWSAVVGLAVGVAGMFGISQDQIKAERAKVELMKVAVTDAIYNLQQGDVKAATINLKEVAATTQKVAADIKEAAEKAKSNKQNIVEKAKEAIVKEVVKQEVKEAEKSIEPQKTETVKTTEATKKSEEAKATETAKNATTEVKK